MTADRAEAFESGLEKTYVVLEEIGKGGGGTVYKAYHKRLKKEVVLKKIHHGLKEINARNETDILKNLKSAYLPQVLDFIEDHGDVFTVMEYIDGKSLEQCLDEGMSFSTKDIVRWFRQLTEAVNLLHTQHPAIIHGDIKPANIMLTETGDICLIDFNVSSIFDGKYSQATGYTPAYAAPEQISFYEQILKKGRVREDLTEAKEDAFDSDATELMGDATDPDATELMSNDTGQTAERKRALNDMYAEIDPRTDIYSLGATMYHIISGSRIGLDERQDIRECAPKIMEPLAFIVMKCISNLPEQRFQTAEELLVALKNVYRSTTAYKKLIARQTGVRVLLMLIMAVSFLLMYLGIIRIRQENEMAYNAYVQDEKQAAATGDVNTVESAFSEAIAVSQTRGDAYVEKAKFLYEQEKYDEAIQFVIEEAIPYITEDDAKGRLYFLAGRCYENVGEYEKAHELFQYAEELEVNKGLTYQEDAVCMALMGDIPEAEKLLAKAKEDGVGTDRIAYTNGEIAYANGEYERAGQYFIEAKDLTEDDYMRMRSYNMLAHIYKERELTKENCDQRIEMLSEAVGKVGDRYLNSIYQELAQAYIDRWSVAKEIMDNENAIMTLSKIVESNRDTFETHQTLSMLYMQSDQFDDAEAELNEMLDLYGEDYRIYMWLAYAEGSRQEEKGYSDRDYTDFAKYTQKAVALYQNQKENNQSDPDMDTLLNAYQQAIDGGWIQGE